VRITFPPGQIVEVGGVTITVGVGVTVITELAVPEHVFVVPVTVYVVVKVGLAVTVAAVVELSPAIGSQLYVVAPLAVIFVPVPPEHIVEAVLFTTTVGVGLTVTVTLAEFPQSPVVPVTVYEVVTAGVAVTGVPVVALNPVAGLHA